LSGDESEIYCLSPGSKVKQEESMKGTVPAELEAATLESVRAILKRKLHQSFSLSRSWLSKLEDREKEQLLTFMRAVGYEKIAETINATWYERVQECSKSQGGDACNTGVSGSGSRNDVAGDQVQQSTTSHSLKEVMANVQDSAQPVVAQDVTSKWHTSCFCVVLRCKRKW
jgi:hypothetical protein